MNDEKDDVASTALIGALARIWSTIRRRHPDVPRVVLLPAPAPRGQPNVLGHFAALKWVPRQDGEELLHEVVVVAEHLDRGVVDVLDTLLHEAAHAMNFHRGIFDCSLTSQYHNKHFAEAAVEIGLEVRKVRNYGFAHTTVPPATQVLYAAELIALETVLLHRQNLLLRRPPPRDDEDDDQNQDAEEEAQPSRSRSFKAVCACPFIIRVSRKTMQATMIRCETCGKAFELA